jgi:hypothetical protein
MPGTWIYLLVGALCWNLLACGLADAQVRQDRAGESREGARPSTPSPTETGRSGQITGTASGRLHFSGEQRQRLQQYFSAHKDPSLNHPDIPATIGAAVPRQVKLRSLPKDVTHTLQKYFGDSYFFAGDRLIIVEPKVRRIVAIIPNVG